MGVDMRPALDSRNAILRLEEEKEVALSVPSGSATTLNADALQQRKSLTGDGKHRPSAKDFF